MSKLRLLFVKEGPAAYISNLDLLRTVQRAFPRTELDIRHSQGFHPHPIISIVLLLVSTAPVQILGNCCSLALAVMLAFARNRHVKLEANYTAK